MLHLPDSAGGCAHVLVTQVGARPIQLQTTIYHRSSQILSYQLLLTVNYYTFDSSVKWLQNATCNTCRPHLLTDSYNWRHPYDHRKTVGSMKLIYNRTMPDKQFPVVTDFAYMHRLTKAKANITAHQKTDDRYRIHSNIYVKTAKFQVFSRRYWVR